MLIELAAAGIPPAEVYRDPRPSRIRSLRAAIPVIRAREELERSDAVINNAGLQGEMKETGPKAKPPKDDGVRIEPVGYQEWRSRKLAEAWPELFSPEAQAARKQQQERERQRAMADAFFGTAPKGMAPAQARLRYVVDEETGHGSFVQIPPETEPAGGAASPQGVAPDHG